MASLSQAPQWLYQAGSQVEQQLQSEKAQDPLADWSLDKIEDLAKGVAHADKYLKDEEMMFTGSKDFDDAT